MGATTELADQRGPGYGAGADRRRRPWAVPSLTDPGPLPTAPQGARARGGQDPAGAGTMRARGEGHRMNVYWFDLEVAGPVTGDHVEALGDDGAQLKLPGPAH